ncbi:MAG: helix-turn-helix domain-containing protein [Planctomycetota bacterium]
MSEKRRKREAEARPARRALIAEVGECEHCGACPEDPHRGVPRRLSKLCVHEIANGPSRQKALDKRFATLVLCWQCNGDDFEDKGQWPEARQLALLAMKRTRDFDLPAYLELTNPNAPHRITLDEVSAYMSDERLKVTDVAELLRVNRRTVQSWIDAGELAATDVRPSGAKQALWRIEYADLLDFQHRRKYPDEATAVEDCENLLGD